MRVTCRFFLIVLTIFAFTGTVSAQGSHIVYGEGFSFMVKDPANWNGFIEDANKHDVNFYFCMSKYNFVNTPVLIYIRVLYKNDNSIEKNLEIDMENFNKTHYVQFSEYKPRDLKYKFSSKQYVIDKKVSDYLCYVDPYDGSPVYIAFVLNGPKDICGEYLNEFQEMIQSFLWIGNQVIIQ